MAKEATQTIGKEIGRKLSVRELGWDKATILKAVLSDQESKHFLGRFIGAVTGLKPYKIKEGERAGETAYGLMGQFNGQGNDKNVDGSVLYLPGYVNDAIVAVFAADDEITSVKIAFDVYAHYDDSSATSYVFTVNDLLNTGSQTVDEVAQEIKALPMPSSATKMLPSS